MGPTGSDSNGGTGGSVPANCNGTTIQGSAVNQTDLNAHTGSIGTPLRQKGGRRTATPATNLVFQSYAAAYHVVHVF